MKTSREWMSAFFCHNINLFYGVLVTAVILARLVWRNWTSADDWVVVTNLILWSPQEWFIHRYVLHGKPWLPPTIGHAAHHDEPRKLELVVTPLSSFAVMMVFLTIFYRGLLGLDWPTVATGLMMWLVLGMHYEMVHFMVHTNYRPQSQYYRKLYDHHWRHHGRHWNTHLCVTMLWADWLFGTNGQTPWWHTLRRRFNGP